MTTYPRRAAALAAIAVLTACGADRDPSARKSALLSDARSDGAPGFYFLPPVAPELGVETPNDPGLSPRVEIAPVDGGGDPFVFEGDAVKASGSHYMVHWPTRVLVPVFGTTYRITVFLDGVALGFADAQVARSGTELHLLGSDEIFGLTGRRTVPIKFRIHLVPDEDACLGVVCPGDDDCNDAVCDPVTGCGTVPVEDLTSCTQTSGPFAGTPGVCVLDPATGVSGCADINVGKFSR